MTEKDGEKKIEDMDSGEFIAHVFYNVLGGLHANEEIDARFGVLEMVEDIKQSREELRTRVAGIDKLTKYIYNNSKDETLLNLVREYETKQNG